MAMEGNEVVSNMDRTRDGDYKVYDYGFNTTGRYMVVSPTGTPLAFRFTLWGARRFIRRRKPSPKPRQWWDLPVVYREAS